MIIDTDKLRQGITGYLEQCQTNHGKPNEIFKATQAHMDGVLADVERWQRYLDERTEDYEA